MNPAASHALAWAIPALSITLMLLRPRGIPEAVWLSAGALLLILLGVLPLRAAGHAVAEGNNVYLFLAGMMLLAELAKFHGVFDWLAQLAVKHAASGTGGRAGRPARQQAARLFTLIYAVGIVVTALLSNDATVVVLTPAVLAAVRKAKTQPLPCLFACAMVANAASFVLPISNPANLLVFRNRMPSLAAWLAAFALPSAIAILTTYALLRWRFRAEMGPGSSQEFPSAERIEPAIAPAMEPAPLSRPGRMTLAGIFFFAAVLLTASGLQRNLGLPTFLAAVAVTGAVCIAGRANPWRLVREISWSVLPLVASLFILVEAINRAGALTAMEHALQAAAQRPAAWGSLAVGCMVGVGSNVVNNLPLGLFAGAALMSGHFARAWSSVIMIGVDLGPNLSTTGSLATILWLIALRREGVEVSGWQFLKTGLVVMPPALLLAICARLAIRGF